MPCPCSTHKNEQYDRLIHDLTVKDSSHAFNYHIDKMRFETKLHELGNIYKATILDAKASSPEVYLWGEDVQEAFHHVKLNIASRPWLM